MRFDLCQLSFSDKENLTVKKHFLINLRLKYDTIRL